MNDTKDSKKPTWVSVVGIVGIVLGCLGILSSIQNMATPSLVEAQKEQLRKTIQRMEANPKTDKKLLSIYRRSLNSSVLDFSKSQKKWAIIGGTLGLIVNGFYIFASACLLSMKRKSLFLFYLATGSIIIETIGAIYIFGKVFPRFEDMLLVVGGLASLIYFLIFSFVVKADKGLFNEGRTI